MKDQSEPESTESIERYVRACQTVFWRAVFEAEVRYLERRLCGCRDILSVGCGPAAIEKLLSERGFQVTGVDVSQQALDRAPDEIRTVAGDATSLPLSDNSFDAVVYIASLQFIKDYEAAVHEAWRVMRPEGRLVAMLLNPQSSFFQQQSSRPGSYVRSIKHLSLSQTEKAIALGGDVECEYFLGIDGDELFDSADPQWAALYVVNATRRA